MRIFRVDNPHTKPFAFWEWCLAEVKRVRPDAIFLAEAFTRPKIMYRLAKLGFTQSYTYFTWRNSKQELTEYFTELTQPELADIFRPNLWTNTPDILHDYLQQGGRPAFIVRAILAATLGANWGVYGPAYELLERTPREPGSEEYLHSEKYELKRWELDRPDSLRDLLGRLNRIRRDAAGAANQSFSGLSPYRKRPTAGIHETHSRWRQHCANGREFGSATSAFRLAGIAHRRFSSGGQLSGGRFADRSNCSNGKGGKPISNLIPMCSRLTCF